MRTSYLLLLLVPGPWSCQPQRGPNVPPRDATSVVIPLSPDADYRTYIGKRVQVVGVVTNTKCPQLAGIDVWSLDAHRGKQVRARGILRETVITQETINNMNRVRMAHRGAGLFYHLDEMEYEVLP